MDNQMNQYDNGNGYRNNRGNGNGGNNRNGSGGNGNGGNQSPWKNNWIVYVLTAVIALVIFLMFSNLLFGGDEETTVKYSEFLEMLEDGQIDQATLNDSGYLYFTKKVGQDSGEAQGPMSFLDFYMAAYGQNYATEYKTYVMESLDTLTKRLDEHNVTEYDRTPADNSGMILNFILTFIVPVLLMWLLLSLLFRKMGGSGGPMGVGKSNAKVYVQKETGVTFKDVAGEDEAKESLQEVVDFLHNPGKYSQIGAKLPKGALLVGPPGTGKTLLARAVAGEAHVPFFSLTGSDFIELYVGVGASRVRDLFKEATKNAPCIIFIDEIDAIGRSRDSKYGGGNEEREQTLNQLLSEMDGFDGSKGILVIGATNRPEILDKALLRPGRFDRRIIVDKPDLKGRVEILKVHAKDVMMDETVDLDAIALATSGAVGSDLANMINEAAINAVKEGRRLVSQKDLFNAVEQVLVGKEKKDRIMSKEERRIVSYHEVGHALVSALQKNSEPVQKITIVPRTMGALGYVMHVPEEEKYLNTEAELRAMLVGLVAGRAAEEVVFDTVTTGAANDIERATGIARAMVTQYGMSKKFGLIGLATIESQYLEGRAALNCSDRTAAEIDNEVIAILKESYEEALRLLRENREVMDKLAEFLIEKETITGKEFMEIFRREKGIPEPAEKKAAEQKAQAVNAVQTGAAAQPEAAAQPGTVAQPEAVAQTGAAAQPETAAQPGTAAQPEAAAQSANPEEMTRDMAPEELKEEIPMSQEAPTAVREPQAAEQPEAGKEQARGGKQPEAGKTQQEPARPVGRFSNRPLD